MRKRIIALLALLMAACLMGGCFNTTTSTKKPAPTLPQQTTAVRTDKELGIIDSVDTKYKQIHAYSVKDNSELHYTYSGQTAVYSRSGAAMTVEQLSAGDVVDIKTSETNEAIEIRISGDSKVWENRKVTTFHINDVERSFKVGQTLYYYDEYTKVYSNGEAIGITELCPEDTLVVRGYDNRIISVVVDRGHGYVTLKDAKYFYGGYIDFGGEIIKVIEENMLITVPEGTYRVEAKNGAYKSEKLVEVVRGENAVIDYSDVMPIVTNYGNVKFNIDVADATLYIDGVATDYSSIVSVVCGNHTIRVEAPGYDIYYKRIEVGLDYLVVDISLDKGEISTETNKGESNVSVSDKVTVKAATGSMIYFDSVCKGIAPVTFDMITGSHTITVIGTAGIKSYNVNLVAGKDVEFDYTAK